MIPSSYTEKHFPLMLSGLCLFYLVIQVLYVSRLPLIMDEFAGMATVLKHRDGIPYRDFNPYKTVLGYYLQLLPGWFSDDIWHRLIFSKYFLASINTLVIFWAALRLRKQMRASSVLIATLLLVTMSTFLERSAEFRVDMLTSNAGLISLIFLLERRVLLAGLVAGLSVLISQKGIFFVLAGGAVYSVECLMRQDRRNALRALVLYGAFSMAPLALYLGIFSLLAGAGPVFHQIFVAPTAIAFGNHYHLEIYWYHTLTQNPFFWGFSLLSILALLWRPGDPQKRSLAIYGLVIAALGIWHKQPWPYFFVLLIPTGYVLLAAFFDRFRTLSKPLELSILGLFLVFGLLLPLSRIPMVLERDNTFQRQTIKTAEAILQEDEGYFAGVNLLPNHRHIPASLSWLDARLRFALRQRQEYRDLLEEMGEGKLKLIIANYRTEKLPAPIHAFLQENYLPLTGNLQIYAPTLLAGLVDASLAFSGTYRVISSDGAPIQIDDQSLTNGEIIQLKEGMHRFNSSHGFRVQLQVTAPLPFPEAKEAATQAFFPNVYDY